MHNKSKRTIRALNVYALFSGMMFWYGIEQLFLNDIADGVVARGAVTAVFGITIGITNLPAGALTDVWGRRRSLRFAVLLQITGLIILGFSNSLAQYLIGAVFFALFWAFDAGSKEALLYDTLADAKQTEKYEKYLGRLIAFMLIGAASANFVSGWMSEWLGLNGNYFMSLIPAAAAFAALLFVYEPEHHTDRKRQVIKQLAKIPPLLKSKMTLRVLMLVGVTLHILTSIIGEFGQIVILEFTDSAVVLGLLWTFAALVMAAGRWFSHKLKSTLAIHIGLLAVFLLYFVLTSNDLSLALVPYLVIFGIIEALFNRNDVNIQEHTPQAMRATVGSIAMTMSSFALVPFALIVGSSEGDSISTILLVTMLPLMLTNIGLVAFLHFRYKNKEA